MTELKNESMLLGMALSAGKKQVAISMKVEEYKKLKKLAVDKGISLSDLLLTACETSKFVVPEYRDKSKAL